jgi:hypothetical protein
MMKYLSIHPNPRPPRLSPPQARRAGHSLPSRGREQAPPSLSGKGAGGLGCPFALLQYLLHRVGRAVALGFLLR